MTKKKDELDKLFVNCNKLKEGEARRLLVSRKELSIKKWSWDVPFELQDINKSMINDLKSETIIGLGRWKNSEPKRKTKYICIAHEGILLYLEPEIVKIMHNSIK